ncbi:DUF5602 domain-containing protein [Allopusillimonas soli]|uniref:TTHB210-like domain-containing protein n=1 Tax=Allopusillimonas soli TaxID=659016 RepID=A0A853FAG4_9BURK|nr:DUF5602 domain-containing protein [Allopusillimonas soli]NYT37704.1 hypothetical protein [Allopusillimonas soli]
MRRLVLPFAAAAALALSPLMADAHDGAHAATAAKAPPAAPYKAVSALVKLPDFIPGMGQLFVDPATLPAGPFLAYDRKGKLVSTIYMLPLSEMKPGMDLDNLASPGGAVDHVDVVYNAGHPGVEEPHIHVVLWHVPVDEEARVAK